MTKIRASGNYFLCTGFQPHRQRTLHRGENFAEHRLATWFLEFAWSFNIMGYASCGISQLAPAYTFWSEWCSMKQFETPGVGSQNQCFSPFFFWFLLARMRGGRAAIICYQLGYFASDWIVRPDHDYDSNSAVTMIKQRARINFPLSDELVSQNSDVWWFVAFRYSYTKWSFKILMKSN